VGDYAFDTDSRVRPTGADGEFAAELTDRWNGTAGAVNGGYMLATCVRALALGMPFPDPIVVSGFFLRPGLAGSATVRTSMIRSGRTTARAHPAPGWLACRATTRFVSNGYHEEDFEVWDSAGTLVAQSRQLALILAS
jgi:Thioesterase-like superfamily